MFRKKQKSKRNLLTMVPLLESRVTLEMDSSSDLGFLIIQRTNFIERLTIRFLKQRAFRKIKLDKFGRFAIEQMAYRKNVQAISEAMIEHFGEEAEPALPRLVKFFEILEVHEWIIWEEEK
ncbi:PqqD family protein [Peribacillus sp. NPDC097206]|uniref:PqqD family protein n=1 Tax=unclassified Peribacillus TaxID=2675266 RepID=UPI00382DFCAD